MSKSSIEKKTSLLCDCYLPWSLHAATTAVWSDDWSYCSWTLLGSYLHHDCSLVFELAKSNYQLNLQDNKEKVHQTDVLYDSRSSMRTFCQIRMMMNRHIVRVWVFVDETICCEIEIRQILEKLNYRLLAICRMFEASGLFLTWGQCINRIGKHFGIFGRDSGRIGCRTHILLLLAIIYILRRA